MNPSLWSFNLTHLDTGEGLVELLHHGAHSGVGVLLAVIHNLADGRDHRRGAAQAGFREIAQLLNAHHTLFHLQVQVVLGNLDQGTAGDGGQDGIGLGNHQLAVLGHEQDVGAAGLLNVGAGRGIHIEVFVIALLMGFHNVIKAHGVIEAGLDVTGASGGRPVQIGNPQGQGPDTALEVGAHGGAEDTELELVGGLDADDGIGAEHIGPQVQARTGAKGRHPGGVGLDGLVNGIQEPLLGEYGHLHPLAGLDHSLRVQVGTEADGLPILGGVGLHALKNGLGILQDAGALAHGDGGVGGQGAGIPGAVLIIGYITVIGLHIAEAKIGPIDVLLFHSGTTPFFSVITPF